VKRRREGENVAVQRRSNDWAVGGPQIVSERPIFWPPRKADRLRRDYRGDRHPTLRSGYPPKSGPWAASTKSGCGFHADRQVGACLWSMTVPRRSARPRRSFAHSRPASSTRRVACGEPMTAPLRR